MYINYLFFQFLFISIADRLSSSAVDFVPTYNPSTRCHDLILADDDLTFAICLQRSSNKQHPFNLYTSPSFCSSNYPPSGRLIDFNSLSLVSIDRLLQSLIQLLNSKNTHIDYPEPNFLWIGSNWTENLTNQSFWCSEQCRSKNSSGKFLILKLRCQAEKNQKPCLTTKHTHWDRAPFICTTNQTIKQLKQVVPVPIHITPTYPNDTIVFYDSTPCVVVRTNTHQYTFCFRRQSCALSQTSAFCTTKSEAYNICQQEKNGSNLLTIENDAEYQLINDIVTSYSNQTLLNSEGMIKNKYIQRAQWMWIDGLRGFNGSYGWNISEDRLTPVSEKYWCDNLINCLGGKGRDHLVLNIICQTSKKTTQVCLASRRESEPGPFICKRTLRANEAPIINYTFLQQPIIIPAPGIVPVYEKNLTSIYYDEHHCLTVQTRTHLYTFCLRRQDCQPRKAYCTRWSKAQKNCQLLKNSQLLTIENEQERTLVSNIMENYHHETRLTFNGSTYRYFRLADFVWIDGIRQGNNQTYLWKNGLELIPNYLWCPRNECSAVNRPRVTLNLLCNQNNSLICLGTHFKVRPAPYICKRPRPIDPCPIPFEGISSIKGNEMLVVTVNRTVALIQCKHPAYNTEIKVQYQCDIRRNQWELVYENNKFSCSDNESPPVTIATNRSQASTGINISISTRPSYFTPTIPSTTQERDCSQLHLSELISYLPAESRYIYSQRLTSYSPLYYDVKFLCHYNNLIQVTYRCDLSTKRWIYIHGNTNSFCRCSPLCSESERRDLLSKYFSSYEQQQIRVKHIDETNFLRLRCFDRSENRWKSISYKCGTMVMSKHQWLQLHSCFQQTLTTTPSPVVISMTVTEVTPSCPPPVSRGNPCEYQSGQYIFDRDGCARKICPSLSQLCATIRCPPDRVCRVIVCKSCTQNDYLQAVCEYRKEPTLCEYERHLTLLYDSESIQRWEQQVMASVRRHATERRQRLRSPWPVLTIN